MRVQNISFELFIKKSKNLIGVANSTLVSERIALLLNCRIYEEKENNNKKSRKNMATYQIRNKRQVNLNLFEKEAEENATANYPSSLTT